MNKEEFESHKGDFLINLMRELKDWETDLGARIYAQAFTDLEYIGETDLE